MSNTVRQTPDDVRRMARLTNAMDTSETRARNTLSTTKPGLSLEEGSVVTVIETFDAGNAFLVEFSKSGKNDSCDWMGVLLLNELEIIGNTSSLSEQTAKASDRAAPVIPIGIAAPALSPKPGTSSELPLAVSIGRGSAATLARAIPSNVDSIDTLRDRLTGIGALSILSAEQFAALLTIPALDEESRALLSELYTAGK